MNKIFFAGLAFFFSFSVQSQTLQKGTVSDAATGDPIPFAKVFAKASKTLVFTDTAGNFQVQLSVPLDTLIVREMSFREMKVAVDGSAPIVIEMAANVQELQSIEINPGANPALRILKKVHKNKSKNDPYQLAAYECDVYSKMQVNLDNLSEKFKERKIVQHVDFILDYVDTTENTATLPVLFSETASRMYYRNNPTLQREEIKATRVVGIEQLDLSKYLGELSQRINVYQQRIVILGRDFISPIARGGKSFYKYHLNESDTVDGHVYHHISFAPRHRGAAVFQGDIWIDDSTYAVQHVVLKKPEDINVNYLQAFHFEQSFVRTENALFLPAEDQVIATFNLLDGADSSSLAGVKVIKNAQRKNFVVGKMRSAEFYKERLHISDDASEKSPQFWDIERPTALSSTETGIGVMIDSLRQNNRFQLIEKAAHFAFTGYWKHGPIEIGNLYSAFNRNEIEGNRIRLTLRSSRAFSNKMRITAYGAYGTRDKQFKYGLSTRWKMNKNPFEVLEFTYKKDIDQLALGYTRFDFGRSLATLLANRPVDKLNLVHTAALQYERDWNGPFRTLAGARWVTLKPLGNLQYRRQNELGAQETVASISTMEFSHSLVFTKEEKFIDGALKRISLGSKFPVVKLTHTLGVANVAQQRYLYNKLDFGVRQTVRLGIAGKIRYHFYAGKAFQNAPFPFQKVHAGSETYYLQKEGFNLMQYYEFISDEWVGLHFEHQLQGLIMDRIPLINRLKIRTVYGAKMVLGNHANTNRSAILLPTFSSTLNGKPYAEISVGIENLFKFVRIDAVWRVTHRNTVGLGGVPAPNFGVRMMFATAL